MWNISIEPIACFSFGGTKPRNKWNNHEIVWIIYCQRNEFNKRNARNQKACSRYI
jgi:hypothetical protein